jgi:ubiquinone/menaquinone biosynthesis C-methylase UbiE
MDTRELRQKYQGFARWYDLVEAAPEVLGLHRLRRKLLARLRGRVLEVAAGTGRNFRWYPQSVTLVAVDLSIHMLTRAREKAEKRGRGRRYLFAVMDAERLAVRDHAFDGVVSTLSTCTFPDPVSALREMGRVARAGGKILLLEHGRSDRPWAARYQDRRAEAHVRMLGCHWNREPLELVRQAGLRVDQAAREFLGVFHIIEARP